MRKIFHVSIYGILLALASAALTATPIDDAAAKGDLVKIKALLEADPLLIESKDKDGATPLHYAAATGKVEVAKYLIEQKADVNACKKDGVTPLHVASSLGQLEAARALLDNRADVNAVDKTGRTPLSLAESKGHVELVALLKTRGAASKVVVKTPPPAVAVKPLPPAPSENIETVARDVVDSLAKGDYAAVVKRFDAKMKSALPETTLKQTWQAVLVKAGQFQRVTVVSQKKFQGYDVVCVSCVFEKATMNAQVSFDSNKQIAGFHILPDGK